MLSFWQATENVITLREWEKERKTLNFIETNREKGVREKGNASFRFHSQKLLVPDRFLPVFVLTPEFIRRKIDCENFYSQEKIRIKSKLQAIYNRWALKYMIITYITLDIRSRNVIRNVSPVKLGKLEYYI